MKMLRDKVVLVTGGARGIGRAIALESARQGAVVIIADIADREMQVTLHELRHISPNSIAVKLDVRRSMDVNRMIDAILSVFSRIDVLFNNAGVVEIHNFLDITEDEWDTVMAVNAKGAFLCAQNVAKVMRDQHSGVIINRPSVACRKGMSHAAAYAASKSAVASLTWTMAYALAEYGIRVNAIAPGMIDQICGNMWIKRPRPFLVHQKVSQR